MIKHGSFYALTFMSSLLCACGSTAEPSGALQADTGVASVDAPEADAAVDSADVADAPFEAGGDAAPTDQPSQQQVRFHVAGSTGYFVTEGQQCASMRIERIDGATAQPVVLGLPYQCGCECPPPPATGVFRASRLIDGVELTRLWDARGLTTYTESVDCGSTTATVLRAVREPIAAGRYRATFVILAAVPAGCTEIGPQLQCVPSGSGSSGTYELCPGGRNVSVEFNVPASGTVDVAVSAD